MPKAAKPVYATVEELETAQSELHSKIDCLKPVLATKAELEGARAKLEQAHDDLAQLVDKNHEAALAACQRTAVDSEAHTNKSIEKLVEDTKEWISNLRTDTELVTDALSDRITSTDAKVREDMANELTTLCENVDAHFAELKHELVELIELRARQAAEALERERSGLDAIIEARRKEAAEDRHRLRGELARELAKLRQEQADRDAGQDAASQKAHVELHARCDEIHRIMEANKEAAAQDSADCRFVANQALSSYKYTTDKHLDALDEECRRLNDQILRTQGFASRRVEWTIKNADTLCRPPAPESGKPHSSWFSPKFHAAGGEDFQLEFRVYPEVQASIDGSPEDSVAACPTGVGDCAVFLWASRGTSAAVRLFAGDRSGVVEKDYGERTAFGTRMLGYVQDHVRREDDALVVGAEFLEAIRKVEAPLPKKDAKVYGDKPCLPMSGALLYQYHFNHRTLPIIRKEIERLQARLVRRVEWKLEQAASLPSRFGPVQPICSAVFAAAGVEGMQLLFYPSGYSGATEAFCSLFLYCPAGVVMKYRLTIGTQVRDCNNAFDLPGAYGRTNYCRYDILPDPQDDSIMIILEIEDVTQDVHVKLGSDATGPKAKGTGNPLIDQAPVPTTMNLKRVPAKESLVDCKPLPSLWSAKALGDVAAPPDGYHTWAELEAEKPKTARADGATSARGRDPGAMQQAATTGANFGGTDRGPSVPFSAAKTMGMLKSVSAVDVGSPKVPFAASRPAALLDVAPPGSPLGRSAAVWPKSYEAPERGLPPSLTKGPRPIPEVSRSGSGTNLPALQGRRRHAGSTY